jgi:hypothetical protein
MRLEWYLSRIDLLGVVVAGLLSGFGAVNFPFECLTVANFRVSGKAKPHDATSLTIT